MASNDCAKWGTAFGASDKVDISIIMLFCCYVYSFCQIFSGMFFAVHLDEASFIVTSTFADDAKLDDESSDLTLETIKLNKKIVIATLEVYGQT